MTATFTKARQLSLKNSPEFTEKVLQQCVANDPSILGLGSVDLLAAEKPLHRAGRLDLLLHDDRLNRRYEVELMLGPTDPSHIIRCIEYWDVERRRYPAYEHVAVLVAEDITSRFLNVIGLLNGNIPLIALQMSALQVDDKVVLHFTRVLDQTQLRTDDEYEFGERGEEAMGDADRSWWEQRTKPELLAICDQLAQMLSSHGTPHRLRYRKRLVDILSEDDGVRWVWCQPRKTLIHIGAYINRPEEWVERFEESGVPATLKRGNRAVRTTVTAQEYSENKALFHEFVTTAVRGFQTDELDV